MTMGRRLTRYLTAIVAVSAVCLYVRTSDRFTLRQDELPHAAEWRTLKCAITGDALRFKSPYLLAGYSYDAVKGFARDLCIEADIDIIHRVDSAYSALMDGRIDMFTLPFADTTSFASTVTSTALDSIEVWVMRESDKSRMEVADEWISAFNSSPRSDRARERFIRRYSPWKSGGEYDGNCLTPYDSLLRKYAPVAGIDWKLFAALAYQESKFRIEVCSPAGAEGLLQFMPRTARVFNLGNPVDPEESIRAGAELLRKLMGYHTAFPGQERINFTLAAYNSGEGGVKRSMGLAQRYGMDDSSWESVRQAIILNSRDSSATFLRDSSITETPKKIGLLQTAYYVNSINSIYRAFCKKEKELR